MQVNNFVGEPLQNLPTNDTEPTNDELMILEKLFKNKQGTKIIFNELKDTFLVGILFILFSTSYIDDIIFKVYPGARNSKYITFIVKIAIIMILFWVINNFALSRN